VGDTTIAAGKKLVFSGLDLDAASAITQEGVYVMPLAKHIKGKLPNSAATDKIAIALPDDPKGGQFEVAEWKIMSNGYHDLYLILKIAKKPGASLALSKALMSSHAQGGRSVASSTLDAVIAKLNPTALVANTFANLTAAHANQVAQLGALARGTSAAQATNSGAIDEYSVSFNHNGTKVGFTYSSEGGNAFASAKGTSTTGVNVAKDVFGLTAIVSASASVDAVKNAYASSTNAAYNAGVTFAKAYNFGGLSVVPMAGLGVSSNTVANYSAAVPMAKGLLGLNVNDAGFSAATFNAGVNFALDDAASNALGATTSVTLGVAGYMASNTTATLSTSEGNSFALDLGGNAYTPYAQFNFGFAGGEFANAVLGAQSVAVSFGLDR
jgi:hypothetical protein